MNEFQKFLSYLGILFLLSSCAETELTLHTIKKLIPAEPKKSKGIYKVGRPYQVNGIWYYPSVNYRYNEKGVASWYGPKFHGRITANGEVFNMNALTAAHRTLPMPSIVQVINLENGRTMRLRINDRGPFIRGRFIDLSRRSAQLLGFEKAGTALVQVTIIANESRKFAINADKKIYRTKLQTREKISFTPLTGHKKQFKANLGKGLQARKRLKSKQINVKQIVLTSKTVRKKLSIFVQAGSFLHKELAEKMKKLLDPIGQTRVIETIIGNRQFYRVQVGPATSVKAGDELLGLVVASGYPNAQLVVQ